jgi:hypothetical protein
MEKSMSSYSFSHQFYQHWTQAPEPIRTAIVQELTDITTLLQPDTPFESFTFNTPDLDTHLDDLYGSYYAQLITTQENTEQPPLAEDKQQNKAQEEQAKLTTNQKLKVDAVKPTADKTVDAKNTTSGTVNHDTVADEKEPVSDIDFNDDSDKSQGNTNAAIQNASVKPKQAIAIESSLPITETNISHEDLIHDLGKHIDDYLSEQMAQLSEDLKSWLGAEISRQLNEQPQTHDSTSSNHPDKKKD